MIKLLLRLSAGITCLVLYAHPACSQEVFTISGKVIDGNRQPLQNTTVHLAGVPGGIMTKEDGTFELRTSKWSDTLELSNTGFETLRVGLKRNATTHLTLQMTAVSTELQNVVINLKKIDKEPGKTFMKKVIANKVHNNPDRFNTYSYDQYRRHEVDVSNLDTADKKNSKGLKNLTINIFRSVDSANANSPDLPLYFSEIISNVYHSLSPAENAEDIVAKKSLGLETDKILQKLDKFNFKFNVYDNWLSIFSQTYASPLSNTAFDYYDFFFSDSSVINGQKVYKIRFLPKQSFERAFIGSLWINDSSYSIKKIDMHLSRTANLNFVRDIHYTQEYKLILDSATSRLEYMPASYSAVVQFENGASLIGLPVSTNKKAPVLTVSNTTVIDHLKVNVPVPEVKTNVQLNNSLATNTDKPETFWEQNRLDTLSRHEKSIYQMVDSLEKNKRYQHSVKAITAIGTGYWDVSNTVRFGPLTSLLSTNITEGVRSRVGFWTMPGISNKFNFNGYIAYGTKDQKLKGGLGAKYVWNATQWSKTSFFMSSDYDYLLDKNDELDNDNLLTSVARKNISSIRVFTKSMVLQHEQYLTKNFSAKATVDYRELTPVFSFAYRPIIKATDQPSDSAYGHTLPVAEASVGFRFSKNERSLVRNYDLIRLDSYNPILTFNYTYGIEIGKANFNYQKLNLGIRQSLKLPPKLLLFYSINVGKTFGTAPYLILNNPPGNESYVDSKYYFNTMLPYEFSSDEYLNLHTRLYLGGSIFDKVPFLNKLGWRERLSFNMHMGNMTAANRAYNSNSYFKIADTAPFTEAGIGIENIFHLISIDYFQRLTNRQPIARQNGGVFVGFRLVF